MDVIIGAGAKYWQIQLTVAMGNAFDHDDILLQPYVVPLLAELSQRTGARSFTLARQILGAVEIRSLAVSRS